MATTVVSAAPFTPVKPIVNLIDGANSVRIECAAEGFDVNVDQDETTTETFCGTFTTYKAEVWTITGSVFQSFGATTGLWNLVRPYVGKLVTFEFTPDSTVGVSISNPKMSGSCYVKAFPFYAGKPGEPQAFDIVIAVQGVPTVVYV